MDKNIAFVTYETPYSPGGGIAAVMMFLPRAIQSSSKYPVFVISPFHHNLTKTINAEPEMVLLAKIKVAFDEHEYDLDILNLNHQDVNWVFLKPTGYTHQNVPFFNGKRHPYDVHSTISDGQPVLLRDSLFFGKAASLALSEIAPTKSWTVLMQDWEAATTILAIRGMDSMPGIEPYITIHNTYDIGISVNDLSQINQGSANFTGDTVLECALPLIFDPIFTVSEQFALDLSSEILQTEIMIPHLKSKLPARLVGVNNGPFVQNSVPNEVLTEAHKGNYSAINNWKRENREIAFEAIDNIQDSEVTPIWGDKTKFGRDEAAWFVMAGRDDSRQKGYEVACIAIERLLNIGFPARFIFFPIPGDEGLPGIEFIHVLADNHPRQVICFPFLFKEGFFSVMRGTTYGIMPSYYEPFGMANEYYLNGVVCIGRATGGICQQIVPNRKVSSFNRFAHQRADLWHKANSPMTGFLFRERGNIPTALEDWHSINAAEYELGSGSANRLHKRKELPTVQSMAEELAAAIEDANHLYTSQQSAYYKMLINGMDFITTKFSWDKAAKTYLELINL